MEIFTVCTRAFSFPVIHPYSGTSRARCGGLSKQRGGGADFGRLVTLFQPGADYAHHIPTCSHPPFGFSDLPTALWELLLLPWPYYAESWSMMQGRGKGVFSKKSVRIHAFMTMNGNPDYWGAKRDENYTLPCYYVRERSIHKSIIFIWFCFIDHM